MRGIDIGQITIDDVFASLANMMTEQRLIEQSLKRGSGFEGGKARILAKYKEKPTRKEFADFLCREYGQGGYGFLQEHQAHDPTGIKIEWREIGNNVKVSLNWLQVATEISRLIERNAY